MRKFILAISMCLLVSVNLLMPDKAAESDFTFNVPVALHNIPSQVSKWLVWVLLDDEFHNRVAEGITYFTVTNGEYTGTVTVAFNARPGYQAATAKTYVIWMQCCLSNSNSYNMPNVLMKAGGQYPCDETKPLVQEIRGSLIAP
jgi:hypothetical protein